MDRLDQKYPQWTKPVHGATYTNGLRLSVSTTKQRLHQLGGRVFLAYVPPRLASIATLPVRPFCGMLQHSSWREDNRRLSNGEQVNRLALCL
jgi:hypothetical protein